MAIFVLLKNIKINLQTKDISHYWAPGHCPGVPLPAPRRMWLFAEITCCPLKQVSSWRLCTGTLSPSSLLRKRGQQFLLGRMTARTIWDHRCCISPLMLRTVPWGISILIIQMRKTKVRETRWLAQNSESDLIAWDLSFQSYLCLLCSFHQVGSTQFKGISDSVVKVPAGYKGSFADSDTHRNE